jgi:lipopolysaccharide/colanic/teichoic acid biosynthesis glycosyltransferase
MVDVLCAAAAMIILSPAFLIIALAIWFESGTPLLYSQLRVGQRGVPFRIYKFRKFRPDCDDRGCPLTMQRDGRLTVVGRALEQIKLDELPQLWNVLRGDMSFVGPRPESMAFADCFRGRFEEILRYKPGLFGPCQVLFRHESQLYPAAVAVEQYYREVLFPAKAEVDLAYYPRRTAASDLGWVLRAAKVIALHSSTEFARTDWSTPR